MRPPGASAGGLTPRPSAARRGELCGRFIGRTTRPRIYTEATARSGRALSYFSKKLSRVLASDRVEKLFA